MMTFKKYMIVFCFVSLCYAQDDSLCAYFTAIPKEPRPDIEDINYSNITWSDTPLKPADNREDVCFGEQVSSGNYRTQRIYIDEEINGDVVVAHLNYQGNSTPYIGTFFAGQRNLLAATLQQDDDGIWQLLITEKQDYETASMRQYMFEVRVEEETAISRVVLEVVNIDDNAPVINVFQSCSIPELGAPGLTDCIYEVTDVDGEISTRFMTFQLNSDRGDEEIFSLVGQNVDNDWYRMTLTIQLETPLDYEASSLHVFSVTASDSLPNNHTVSIMVEVINVEHRNPLWVEIWAVQQFNEKTYQNFTFKAIDGDTGINKPIYYRLDNENNYPFFEIETLNEGYDGGILHVSPIDRDELQQEIFQLSIVAYKYDNESFSNEAPIVIIVNDVNDQIPEPLNDIYIISIMEETPLTLNFDEDFGFYDRDLGEHAQYQVTLEDIYPPGAASAFYISPEVGYQRQIFTMGTRNHSMLDYEVPEFQEISIRVVAQDLHTPEHIGYTVVTIQLINWNDEEPMFDADVHSVSFDETAGYGYEVFQAAATDRDIDDRVVYYFMSTYVDYLSIDENTGLIVVTSDDAFNYNRQSEIVLQIRADDTLGEPYHTTTSQLIIQLNDINNTPPTLRLTRNRPQIEENVPEGYVVTEDITASDPDGSAYLVFEIDWETSYATKQGLDADPSEFYGCVEIETVYANNDTRSATGRLVVKEIRPGVTIDYEEYEVLYLTVRVTDLNTVIGDDHDELVFAIIIIDLNDNRPIWTEGSLDTSFSVREMASSGVVVGSVLATDIDGVLYNQVRYTILPREDTPAGLIKIDQITGQITVDNDTSIDADQPVTYNLYYTVVASDRCLEEECPPDDTVWETPGNITIQIIDTNNKIPEALTNEFNTTVRIYENATTGDHVMQILAFDLDRDDIYHKISYQINYQVNARIRDFFAIDLDSGNITVEYTTNEVLDRDADEPEHSIFVTMYDNFYSEGDGNRNQESVIINVVLLDVNDNAPQMPSTDKLSWTVLENAQQCTRLTPEIEAPDIDEPNTDNSRVGYSIVSLASDRDIQVPELFTIINVDNKTGEIEIVNSLKGYWGSYNIGIMAYDHGIPQQSSSETYSLTIRPYNYNVPQFNYPQSGSMFRLSRERATANSSLVLVNGDFLGRVSASDDDGLDAGVVTFAVIGDAESQQHFGVVNDGTNLGTLILRSIFTEETKEFKVTIRATDSGTEPGPLFSDTEVHLVYVPTFGNPVFDVASANISFIENQMNPSVVFSLPLANDPKNYLCVDDCHNIYYSIIDGDPNEYFQLNSVTNELSLSKALIRNESLSYTLVILASNEGDATFVTTESLLFVSVTVREEDPRPVFLRSIYTAGISTSDTVNKELFTVRATHSDNLSINYTIDLDTMVVHASLENVKNSAFLLHPLSGVMTLNIQPTASMHGMFQFDILATDLSGAESRVEAKIHLVSSENRIYFLFNNPLDDVIEKEEFIAKTFSTTFNMTCNIDQIVPATDEEGIALEEITQVRAHFIKDDTPVLAIEVEQLRSDAMLVRSLQISLSTESLLLQDLLTDSTTALTDQTILLNIVIALCAILAIICLVVIAVFVVKIRSLNRQLAALSTSKFSAIDATNNRPAILAPNTNKHAIAGSNPVWNEKIKAPDFDTISDDSDDSDLVGVEDLPQFLQDYYTKEERDCDQNDSKGVSNHKTTCNKITHSKWMIIIMNNYTVVGSEKYYHVLFYYKYYLYRMLPEGLVVSKDYYGSQQFFYLKKYL